MTNNETVLGILISTSVKRKTKRKNEVNKMECYNSMQIEMNSNSEAMKAMEIIKTVLNANKETYNKEYCYDVTEELISEIKLDGNCLVITSASCFFPEESEAFTDIIVAIATQLKSSFVAEINNWSTYTEGWIDATCDGKVLSLKTTYFPFGSQRDFLCNKCEKEIEFWEEVKVAPNEYEIHFFGEAASGKCTCPNCGAENDIFEMLPIITTSTINI